VVDKNHKGRQGIKEELGIVQAKMLSGCRPLYWTGADWQTDITKAKPVTMEFYSEVLQKRRKMGPFSPFVKLEAKSGCAMLTFSLKTE